MQELLTIESKYKRLEYIQSTGTQYIDTGISGYTDFDLKFQLTNIGSNEQTGYFGHRDDADSNRFGCINYNNTFHFMIGNKFFWNIPVDLNIHVLSMRKYTFIDNNTSYNWSGGSFGDKTFYLFACNGGNNNSNIYSSQKVYYAKFYNNNNLIKDLVPVLRKSDNEIGMLDLVEGKFYPNAGTGKFTANLDTMYALIQGTPTVQDGMVSNFSATNYLKTKAMTLGTNFEIKISFITPNNFNDSANKNIIGFGTSVYWLSVISDGRIRYRYSSYGDAINYIETGILATNTKYDLILGQQQSGTIYLKYKKSSESEYITVTHSYDATIFLSSNEISFGTSMSSYPRPFDKSIDLNRSYIKIDDTKYKLQAVVGYSKVGTLTENPTGVFSGFDSSNYLLVNSNIPTTNLLEYNIKFTTSVIGNIEKICGQTETTGFAGIGINADGILWLDIRRSGGFSDIFFDNYTLQNNTTYIANITFVKGSSRCKLYNSNKQLLFTQTKIISYTENLTHTLAFGKGAQRTFTGTIDMNETWIKINNKLWFNGLEA